MKKWVGGTQALGVNGTCVGFFVWNFQCNYAGVLKKKFCHIRNAVGLCVALSFLFLIRLCSISDVLTIHTLVRTAVHFGPLTLFHLPWIGY